MYAEHFDFLKNYRPRIFSLPDPVVAVLPPRCHAVHSADTRINIAGTMNS